MRGIVMASGSGTRLFPLTKVITKQLLPVWDKPLIYYPLSTLMLAGIREVILIIKRQDENRFRALFQDGSSLGMRIEYAYQDEPIGIADGIRVAAPFIGSESIALILGDNIFYGSGLGRNLSIHSNVQGARVFAYAVSRPTEYGVIEIDSRGKILSLEEKPNSPKSNLAVTGLYFYDNSAIDLVQELTPSPRGELEITDLNLAYLKNNSLSCSILPRGTAWLDTGSFQGLHDASTFVRLTEERTGLRIGDPFEVAKIQRWIT